MIPGRNAGWLALLFSLACGTAAPASDSEPAQAQATPAGARVDGEATGPGAPGDAGHPESHASAAAASSSALTAWTPEFTPPPPPRTDRLRLEVLGPDWAELDYEALMGSRDHLRRTLHWGSWPRANFTLAENRGDLERHLGEFERREAFAYTVLDAEGEESLGCIYLNPARGEERSAMLAMWIVESELESDLDEHLLRTVVTWLENDWPLDRLFVLLHVENERGARIARKAGFTAADRTEPDHLILQHALE